MKTSVVVTVFNEQKTILALLESLLSQGQKPSEIIVLDAESTDKTVQIVRRLQKKHKKIKIVVEPGSRAHGRNLGVKLSKNEIIVMTDAGCVAKNDWIEKITKPFLNEEVQMVAGFYKMTGNSNFQKAAAIFLGVQPKDFNDNFLPSTRSVAFKKSLWKKVGGFSEQLKNTAEDTVFNYEVVKTDAKIARVKTAVVEWGMPETIPEFFNKIKNYAKGDIKTKIWWHPEKKLSSHNIKALFVLIRYTIGFILLILGFVYPPLWPVLILGFLLYSLRAYRKAKIWGIALQYISDFAVISGFVEGMVRRD